MKYQPLFSLKDLIFQVNQQRIHMKHQTLFSLKDKSKKENKNNVVCCNYVWLVKGYIWQNWCKCILYFVNCESVSKRKQKDIDNIIAFVFFYFSSFSLLTVAVVGKIPVVLSRPVAQWFMECSIFNPALSLLMKHLVISQHHKAPFSAFHWPPHGSLVSIGQHFVITRVVHLLKRTKQA